MTLMQEDMKARLASARRIAIAVPEGPGGLLPAAVLALALEDRAPTLHVRAPEPSAWGRAAAEWFAAHDQGIRVSAWDGGPLEADLVVAAGGPDLLRSAPVPGCGLAAMVGTDPSLAGLVAHGGILAAEVIPRFGPVGRKFVELVEHVHHQVGPEGQCTAADALRAALFGRHGLVPVNLATREAPVAIGPASTIVWFLDPAELARA